jgi:hypothetical protein
VKELPCSTQLPAQHTASSNTRLLVSCVDPKPALHVHSVHEDEINKNITNLPNIQLKQLQEQVERELTTARA